MTDNLPQTAVEEPPRPEASLSSDVPSPVTVAEREAFLASIPEEYRPDAEDYWNHVIVPSNEQHIAVFLKEVQRHGLRARQRRRIIQRPVPSHPLLRPKVCLSEAARILKVSLETLRGLIDDGKIPVVRIGERTTVFESDLVAFLSQSYGNVSRNVIPRFRPPGLPISIATSPLLQREKRR